MRKIIICVFATVVMCLYMWTVVLGNDLLQPSIASKILRFHVLANSDSSADQKVKEKVRDAVGIYLQPGASWRSTAEKGKCHQRRQHDTDPR